jgi:hypothetical protein
MSESKEAESGRIAWVDLTVRDAEPVRDFYREVVGWTSSQVDMGEYSDYSMNLPGSGETVAGVCHARGVNADLPPVWLIYVTVRNLDESLNRCVELGGFLVSGPKDMAGQGRYCVIEDPAGAVVALFEPGAKTPA